MRRQPRVLRAYCARARDINSGAGIPPLTCGFTRPAGWSRRVLVACAHRPARRVVGRGPAADAPRCRATYARAYVGAW